MLIEGLLRKACFQDGALIDTRARKARMRWIALQGDTDPRDKLPRREGCLLARGTTWGVRIIRFNSHGTVTNPSRGPPFSGAAVL